MMTQDVSRHCQMAPGAQLPGRELLLYMDTLNVMVLFCFVGHTWDHVRHAFLFALFRLLQIIY